MPWTLRETKTKVLTSQLAREFASMTQTPRERPLSERRIGVYRKCVEAGQFRPFTWASADCKETGERFRVNGQHTSAMFSTMEKLPELYVNIERYDCDTAEDVARLYATFDSMVGSRNASDINRAFAASVPELSAMQTRIVTLCVTGLSYFKWRNSYGNVPAGDRAELLLDNIQFATWLNGIHSGGQSFKSLMRGPVAAAMFATWQKSQRDATEFWAAVRDETGIKPTLPDRRLAKYLSTINVALGGGGKFGPSRKASPAEFYAKCLHAWNAWRKGEATDLKYYASSKPPVAV